MPKPFLHNILRGTGILLIALIAVVSAWFVSGLRIEQDNESMKSDQAQDDPVYQHFKEAFDAEYELILTVTRDDLVSEKGRAVLKQAAEWAGGLPGVREVHAPTGTASSEELVSADGRTAGLLLVLDSKQSRTDRVKLLNTLRTEASGQIDGTVYVVGSPVLKDSIARHIARDQRVVTPLSVLVMMIMLAILFRRAAGVVLPMLVVGLSLLTTLGLYAGLGHDLNSITSLLPAVIIVLSVSAAVHLFDAWIHTVDSGISGAETVRAAVKSVWKPCVFTAAMTAAGLLSLLVSPIPAVRLFGVFAAAGVSLSVLFTFSVLPIALAWVPQRPSTNPNTWMQRFLHLAAELPACHPVAILIVALLISLAGGWAAMRVKNNTDLIHFFKKSDPTYIAHEAVNRSLGSVRTIDLLLQNTDGSAFNPLTDLSAMESYQKQIEAIPDVVRVDSMLAFFHTPAAAEMLSIPNNRFAADQGRTLRFQVHLADIGSSRAAAIGAEIRTLAKNTLPSGWTGEPTGAYYQVVRDSNQLVDTLLKSFATTLAIVLVSTCLLFRTVRVLIPAFIPNMLPILWGAGLMGALNIDLSTGTTMVAAVVIGLAVDDTIHYLHHFQAFRHLPVRDATRLTTRRIGRALTVSSIVLVCGFWMGAFGSFIPTNTFALLTGGMMASALFCDLLVLPAWLNLTFRPQPLENTP